MVITPNQWTAAKKSMQTTPTGLYHLAGWFGSTHTEANWRKEHDFLEVFRTEQVHGFDPQVDNWDPSYSAIEADVMANASVIIIRLENNELINGSLGSIAEIGLALTSAALRGQVVVVSIEDGMLTSLNEPGAIAQYMIIEMFLEQWEKEPALAGLLHIHRGNNLSQLAQMICQAAAQQMKTSQKKVDFEAFLKKKARHKHNYPMRVVLGGSGGPYAKAHEASFNRKKEALIAPYLSEGQVVKILSEGVIADAWQIPHGSVDHIGVAMATRTLLSIESDYKREADVLLVPIMTEAASNAAATEIGLLLLSALTTGQWVKIYLEPFDPVDYLKHRLENAGINPNGATEKEMRLALKQAGLEDDILATADKAEVDDAFSLLKTLELEHTHLPKFRQIKKSLLGQTQIFGIADNIQRVRTLVQAHMEALHNDARFEDFFSYATRIEI